MFLPFDNDDSLLWNRELVVGVQDRVAAGDLAMGGTLKTADWHPAIGAAWAHVAVAAVHPFRDGNGRTTRVLASLAMYRGGFRHPAFTSLEEWWDKHPDRDITTGYYSAMIDASAATARNDLVAANAAGFLEREGRTWGRRYRRGPRLVASLAATLHVDISPKAVVDELIRRANTAMD